MSPLFIYKIKMLPSLSIWSTTPRSYSNLSTISHATCSPTDGLLLSSVRFTVFLTQSIHFADHLLIDFIYFVNCQGTYISSLHNPKKVFFLHFSSLSLPLGSEEINCFTSSDVVNGPGIAFLFKNLN